MLTRCEGSALAWQGYNACCIAGILYGPGIILNFAAAWNLN